MELARWDREKVLSLRLDAFEGPLDLLLKLIEEEKLPITQIAIAQVTEQYLHVLKASEEGMHPELLADFLVVAARLLWHKTKALFPSLAQESGEEDDLAAQLKTYQRFVEASKAVEEIFTRRHAMFSRAKLGGGGDEVIFMPPSRLTAENMKGIFLNVIHSLQPLVRHSKEVLKRAASLRDTIRKVEQMLQGQGNTRFSQLLSSNENRAEIIVTFLAVLELVKQRTVLVRQEGIFGEMVIVSHKITESREYLINESQNHRIT